MRKVFVAAVAILLLAGGAMLAVYLMSGGPEPSGGEPPAPPPPPPTGPPAPTPLARDPGSAPAVEYAPRPPPPPPGSWGAVPIAHLRSLGPAGVAIQRGLTTVAPRIAACFEEEAQARHGQAGYTATVQGTEEGDPTAPSAVVLQLEALEGQVRIADAPVESRGAASDGLIACAQQALRGQTFPVRGLKPGSRYRVVHVLVP